MLLDQVRDKARLLHRSIRTERAYIYWIKRYLQFHKGEGEWKHPSAMGAREVEAFLTDLAVQGRVSASTQNQALAALLFLYQTVLGQDLGRLDALRARRPQRAPLVLSRAEVGALLAALDGLETQEPYGLMARLMYGAGTAAIGRWQQQWRQWQLHNPVQ